MEFKWEEGFSISVRCEGGQVVICANKAGLLSMANHLKALVEESAGGHFHLDQNNSLEEGSIQLVVEKS